MSYSPIDLVTKVHELPHLSSSLSLVSNSFGIYNNDYWNDYTRSLLPLPSIIGALGFLSISILLFGFCLRICCVCCRCGPGDALLDRQKKLNALVSYNKLKWGFIFIAGLAILCDQSIFFGNRDLDHAVSTTYDALSFLEDSFTVLNNDGLALESIGIYLLGNASAASASGCGAVGTVVPDINQFNNDVADYISFVSPVPSYINDAQDAIHTFGVEQKNSSIWGLYIVCVLAVVFFGLGLRCQGKLCLQYTIAFAVLVVLALVAMCAVEMVVMMGLADFCISPIPFTLQVMDPTSTNYEMTSYYATCTGTSPLTAPLSSAQIYATDLTNSISNLLTVCPGNAYVANMASQVQPLNTYLGSIVNTTDCPPYQSEIESVLQNGVCNSGYSGFFTIWVTQYLTAMFLFILCILASIIYQYFGQFWDLDEQQQKDELLLGSPVYNDVSGPSGTAGVVVLEEKKPYFDPESFDTKYNTGHRLSVTHANHQAAAVVETSSSPMVTASENENVSVMPNTEEPVFNPTFAAAGAVLSVGSHNHNSSNETVYKEVSTHAHPPADCDISPARSSLSSHSKLEIEVVTDGMQGDDNI